MPPEPEPPDPMPPEPEPPEPMPPEDPEDLQLPISVTLYQMEDENGVWEDYGAVAVSFAKGELSYRLLAVCEKGNGSMSLTETYESFEAEVVDTILLEADWTKMETEEETDFNLSMLVLGIKLAEIPLKKLFSSGKMYYVSAIRLLAFPVLCVALVLALQQIPFLQISDDVVRAFFIAFAMPTAGLAAAFADQYKGDTENAVIFTLGTTVLSVATIPVLYMLTEWIIKII